MRLVLARGNARVAELGADDVLAVGAVGHPRVHVQVHDHLGAVDCVVGDVFGDGASPLAVAFDTVPGLGAVCAFMAGGSLGAGVSAVILSG